MAAARQSTRNEPALSSARAAVAIEILLTCSMRVGNLIDLRFGETIRKLGEGPPYRWVIEVPGEKVKNGHPLPHNLRPNPLIEKYLADWHHC
jgi:hypothetical protein